MKKILLLALLYLCAPPAQAETPKPLLWQVSDDDNSVYLLGSFHMLKAEDYPLSAAVDKAFEAAGKVYFEISPEEMNNPEVAKKMLHVGMFAGEQTLRQSLKPETWGRLEKYCAARKIPIGNFQKFEPWLLALVLSIAEMQKLGLQPQFGLDRHFAQRAREASKPTGALETIDAQFALFDNMNAEEQEQSLAQTLEEAENMQQIVEQMHQLWRNGDAEGLRKLAVQEMADKTPQFYQRILVDRNNAWLPQIKALLTSSNHENSMVVVGSMHLLGDDGLVNLLQRQGFRVARLP